MDIFERWSPDSYKNHFTKFLLQRPRGERERRMSHKLTGRDGSASSAAGAPGGHLAGHRRGRAVGRNTRTWRTPRRRDRGAGPAVDRRRDEPRELCQSYIDSQFCTTRNLTVNFHRDKSLRRGRRRRGDEFDCKQARNRIIYIRSERHAHVASTYMYRLSASFLLCWNFSMITKLFILWQTKQVNLRKTK